jgi:hypothetical protein
MIAKKNTLNSFFKNRLLQNQLAKINQTMYKLSLGKENSSFFQIKNQALFHRGDNQITKM